jgi:glycerol kinase
MLVMLAKEGGIDRLSRGYPWQLTFRPKIEWILEHVPAALQTAHNGDALFGNIDTWVIWWLPVGHGGGLM